MTRRVALAMLATLVCAACGGGGTSAPSTVPTPLAASPSPDPAKLVVLDAGNFDALVLGAARPCLVEFHLPT